MNYTLCWYADLNSPIAKEESQSSIKESIEKKKIYGMKQFI